MVYNFNLGIGWVIGKLFLSEKLKIGSKLKEKALKIFR